METPKVSIIVPCYKKAEYMSETLDSVLEQTYQNWECVIVNDGSPDNTEEIAKKYINKDCRFVYLKQDNQGVSVARNNGIRKSTGKFILPLDADDLIDPTYIEKAIKHFLKFPSTKLVYCKSKTFGQKIGYYSVPDYSFEELHWTCMIPCSCIYRRKDYDNTDGYNPTMRIGYEDWDFLLSLLDHDSIVYRIDEILFHYRTTDTSRNMIADTQSEKLMVQIYRNHKELYEPYAERVIIEHHKYNNAKKHADEIYDTASYKLGYAILHPLVKIKKMFSKHNSNQ